MKTMKRLLIAIIGLMLCCGLSAQTRTCQYWFDGNYGQHVDVTLSGDSWDGQLDASSLSDGIHTVHLHLIDTAMTYTRNYLFRKISTISASSLDYYFWYDNDINNMQNGSIGNGTLQLDATGISTGLHTLHLMLKGDDYGYTRNYLFIKTEMSEFIPNLTYHCWFDENMSQQQTGVLGNSYIILDANSLGDGEHVVHVFLEGSTVAATQSFVFVKGGEGEIYQITATATPADCGTVMGAGSYYDGNLCVLIATPSPGYGFIEWQENGNTVSTSEAYSFTVSGDRNLEAVFSPLSVDEQDYEYMVVYPNPVKDRLMIESVGAIRQCDVYSITGRLMFSLSESSEQLEVPVENLPAGAYIIRLITDGSTQIRKFIKE